MIDYNDGEWHLWDSRHIPNEVHPESLVTYLWHNERWGKCGMEEDVPAGKVVGTYAIKFRVTKPFRGPRVIWVNEYSSGDPNAHSTEAGARKYAEWNATRVAVRYVETPEQ